MTRKFFTNSINSLKSIQSLRNKISPKSILLHRLTDSIKANQAILEFRENGIFVFIGQDKFQKVLFWNCDIQESDFKTNEIFFHCYGCQEALELFKKQPQKCRLTCNSSLLFYVGVFSRNIQTKMFNDRPLKLCPKCSNTFLQYYSTPSPENFKKFLQQ